MAAFEPGARMFVRGSGSRLTDAKGHEVFDAISSVWTTIHGHGHPAIVAAIARQARELDHATTLGATNPRAEELAARLCALARLDVAFFASDGASAVEAALKMALQYWQQSGEPERRRFVHLRAAYHGDTAGAMGVSDIALFKDRFGPLLVDQLPYDDLAPALARDDVAAIVVEPLVQAAAGLRIVAAERYGPLHDPGRRPLLIVDEIATGFGRTGTLFAHEQLALAPDLVCVGKGLTGGALALSAVLARRHVYEAFLGEPAAALQFFHGHSYAGNPIACAAALASLRLFESEGTLARVTELETRLETILAPLRALPAVADVRRAGLMVGIELAGDTASAARAAQSLANDLYARGQFTRPIGATVQLVPPLIATAAELEAFVEAFVAALASRP